MKPVACRDYNRKSEAIDPLSNLLLRKRKKSKFVHCFEDVSWLPADISGCSYLGNSLMYLLPDYILINSVLSASIARLEVEKSFTWAPPPSSRSPHLEAHPDISKHAKRYSAPSQSHSFSHQPKLMTVGECRNIHSITFTHSTLITTIDRCNIHIIAAPTSVYLSVLCLSQPSLILVFEWTVHSFSRWESWLCTKRCKFPYPHSILTLTHNRKLRQCKLDSTTWWIQQNHIFCKKQRKKIQQSADSHLTAPRNSFHQNSTQAALGVQYQPEKSLTYCQQYGPSDAH